MLAQPGYPLCRESFFQEKNVMPEINQLKAQIEKLPKADFVELAKWFSKKD